MLVNRFACVPVPRCYTGISFLSFARFSFHIEVDLCSLASPSRVVVPWEVFCVGL